MKLTNSNGSLAYCILQKYFTICRMINVGLSLPKEIVFICFTESPLKIMKSAFYFVLKAFFVLKIFRYILVPIFSLRRKTA